MVGARRSARLSDRMERGVVDDRVVLECELGLVKVEEKVELGLAEMVKVEEKLDVEGKEVGVKGRNRGIEYGGTGGCGVRRCVRLNDMGESDVV